MKITYIHHSSFLVECEQANMLFDYFEGNLPDISKEKPLYIFSSHRHADHFSPVIFNQFEHYDKVTFILSNDIWANRVPKDCLDKTVFLGKNTTETIGQLEVSTLRSTDEGIAFLVTLGKETIYHAGDLNDWTWIGEEEDWNKKMRRVYRSIVSEIKEVRIDAAFLPLDGRQGEEFYQGMDYFLKTAADVGAVFPMHCWGDYTVIPKLKAMPQSATYRDKIRDIDREGQVFELKTGNDVH